MRDVDIIITAFKMEARSKPNEKIIFGWRVYTFKKFVGLLDQNRKLEKEEKKIVKNFLKTSLKMFKENKSYRMRMLNLAGIKDGGNTRF